MPKIWLNPSSLVDFQYGLVGGLIFSSIISYTTFTTTEISVLIYKQLGHLLGAPSLTTHSAFFCSAIITAILYLAYELAYWTDHYISHKFPILWEFHKVHHSAKVLTPFTNWRVHPVDTIVFTNIVALVVGAAHGLVYYMLGKEIAMSTMIGTNFLIFFYMALYGHLQHSHLWISFTGLAGHVFLSPAHHQIHHSDNPKHFDKNFGAGLAIFDWLFGTLHLPSKDNENLNLGTSDDNHLKQLVPSLFIPFKRAWSHLERGVMSSTNKLVSSSEARVWRTTKVKSIRQ
jgi:sterol desaturase/sphingolipid hydroxylase (fatty acid hydroxylase superfamily)